jgi:hypothetical protein
MKYPVIQLDIVRTMTKVKIFQEQFIMNIESEILAVFALNHSKISYKQGMNEILAILIYVLYPYYSKTPIQNYSQDIIEKWVNDAIGNHKNIYHFFYDINEFEYDLYV